MLNRRKLLTMLAMVMIVGCSHSGSGAIGNFGRFRMMAPEDPPLGAQFVIKLYNDNGNEKVLVASDVMQYTGVSNLYGKQYQSRAFFADELYQTNVVEYWMIDPATGNPPNAYPNAIGADTAFTWNGMTIIEASE